MRVTKIAFLVVAGCSANDTQSTQQALTNMPPAARVVSADGSAGLDGSGHPNTFAAKANAYLYTLSPSSQWTIGEGDYTFTVLASNQYGDMEIASTDPAACRRVHINAMGNIDLVYTQSGCAHASAVNSVNGGLDVQLAPFGASTIPEILSLDGVSLARYAVVVEPVDPAQTSGYEFDPNGGAPVYWQQFFIQTGPMVCGDGTLTIGVGGAQGEECDDGNAVSGDGCSATCQREACGDTIDGSACPTCGNGIVDANEQCDDGNTASGDGCSATCTVEAYCGNGVLDAGEECDDGNTSGMDGCSVTCHVEHLCCCGDGHLDQGEQCDDGNSVSGDGCSEACAIEGLD
jgi:cysteine-rich repeat protein